LHRVVATLDIIKKWLVGANFPLCFFSFSCATGMARTFRLIVQLHCLNHIRKQTKMFRQITLQVK